MAAAAAAGSGVRDSYGFTIKPEFQELFLRFAPIYEAEEAERSQRWDEFLAELQGVVPRWVRLARGGDALLPVGWRSGWQQTSPYITVRAWLLIRRAPV